MKKFESLAVRHISEKLEILDQRQLPHREVWLESTSPSDMITYIKQLSVRGAPMIGICAALALSKFVEKGASKEQTLKAAEKLRNARPTAINLMYCLDRMLAAHDYTQEAESIMDEENARCSAMAKFGASLINKGDGILTHCNTGNLATTGIGTAIGVISEAFRQGKEIHVYVDETRPLLQGGRLTAWELRRLGIPYTLICDNMAAPLMRDGKIQCVFVGADRIAANGDFANKIGTYSTAILAHHHGIPFYPVAPISTIDFACPSGKEIPIEMRESFEVQGFGDMRWSPEDAQVYNPAFDVTPVELIESLILDTGIMTKEELRKAHLTKERVVCGQ